LCQKNFRNWSICIVYLSLESIKKTIVGGSRNKIQILGILCIMSIWVCCPNQGGVAGSKFRLEQGDFEIGMPGGISSRSERRSRTKIATAQRVAAAWTYRDVAHAGKACKDSPA